MTHRCHECSRLNPGEATFCYFDGVALNGHRGAVAGSIDFSSWAFPSPFVFPGGQQCHNFLQLSLACHQNPQQAIQILQGGFLESFLGSLGRVDLALVARSAARSPDPERGLDDLLGKLPGCPLRPAQLQVEPVEKSFGIVQVGEDHHFELVLTNQGDRLLYGKAMIEDCPWLSLGDGVASEKIFQLSERFALTVHVRGKLLRAYHKQQKAEIALESNGGNILVAVNLTVPIKPFPEGVLSGATTPRQLAEKAKAHPKEAAVLIENGAVAAWYASNGWTYPVQGPTASGIAAVQQLFEVLGLVRSPKVEVSEAAVTLRGSPGTRLEYVVTAQTQEKRAAVAHGVSDQPWLTVGKTVFRGQQASIPLLVEHVPAEPGRTLTAHLKVTANGNQRFDIPVSLIVGPGDGKPMPAVPPIPVVSSLAPVSEAPALAAAPAVAAVTPIPVLVPAVAPAPVEEASPFSNLAGPPPMTPMPVSPSPETAPAAAVPVRRPRPWKQMLPIGIVVVGLLAALVRDLLLYEPAEEPLPEVDYANPSLNLRFHDRPLPDDFVPVPSMTFGLGMPDPADRKKLGTRLVYDEYGRTNNVCVRIDGTVEYLWGIEQGAWKGAINEPLGKDREGHTLPGARSVWERNNPNVTITQYAEIVPGGLSADGKKRLLDTCLIRYDITNNDAVVHRVGLRFLLDTFIGSNDAVPFTIAGARELCDTKKEFNKPEDVPDFISALERQDLKNPGTVAHVSLKYGGGLEPPTRVTLGAWPASSLRTEPGGERADMQKTRWEVPVLPMSLAKSAENPNGDSAVTLYWDDKDVAPKGGTRTVGFAYGLGNVSGDKGEGQLGLTAGGALVVDQEFTLTAYVKNPAPGTTITLSLPAGLQLVGGNEKENVAPIPAGASSPYSPVTWRVKSSKYGILPVKATLSSGATVRHKLVIEKAKKFLD